MEIPTSLLSEDKKSKKNKTGCQLAHLQHGINGEAECANDKEHIAEHDARIGDISYFVNSHHDKRAEHRASYANKLQKGRILFFDRNGNGRGENRSFWKIVTIPNFRKCQLTSRLKNRDIGGCGEVQ